MRACGCTAPAHPPALLLLPPALPESHPGKRDARSTQLQADMVLQLQHAVPFHDFWVKVEVVTPVKIYSAVRYADLIYSATGKTYLLYMAMFLVNCGLPGACVRSTVPPVLKIQTPAHLAVAPEAAALLLAPVPHLAHVRADAPVARRCPPSIPVALLAPLCRADVQAAVCTNALH